MMKKKGIFYFSSINYNFLRQRPQQLYQNLKEISEEYEVFYIDPPQLKLHEIQASEDSLDKNVIMPIPGHLALLGRIGILLKPLIKYLINRKVNDYNLEMKIAILASPIWEPYVSSQDFDIICYDYMDSLELYGFNDRHARLVRKSDLIFTTAQKLKEEIYSNYKKKPVLVSNGVDPEFFREKSKIKIDFSKKKPVVGYVGAIYDWIDLEMIYESAKSLPKVYFVFVGPLTPLNKDKALKKPGNVYFLGQKDYEEIPAYVNAFDVAIIPFQRGEVALTTDPIKVYEYFSLGKPVVATAIKQLEKFDDGQILKLAKDKADFVDSVNFFLKHDNEKWQEARKEIAIQNSWSKKAVKILESIDKLIST